MFMAFIYLIEGNPHKPMLMRIAINALISSSVIGCQERSWTRAFGCCSRCSLLSSIIKQLKEAINWGQSTCDLSCHTRTTGKGGWATSGSAMRGGAAERGRGGGGARVLSRGASRGGVASGGGATSASIVGGATARACCCRGL